MTTKKNTSFDTKRAALLKNLTRKEGVTEIAIKNVYGAHAMAVIRDHVEPKPAAKKAAPKADGKRTRRPPTRYGAAPTVALPSEEEFRTALHKKYTTTARQLVEDAYSEIESLASEARHIEVAASGTKLENTRRIETFNETASTLEHLYAPELTDAFDEVEVVRLPTLSNATSRAHRLCEAMLDLKLACIELDKWLEDKKNENDDTTNEEKNATATAIDDIQADIAVAEGVEFPGMYG